MTESSTLTKPAQMIPFFPFLFLSLDYNLEGFYSAIFCSS